MDQDQESLEERVTFLCMCDNEKNDKHRVMALQVRAMNISLSFMPCVYHEIQYAIMPSKEP